MILIRSGLWMDVESELKDILSDEGEALYIGEINELSVYHWFIVKKGLQMLINQGVVKEQNGFKNKRYFYNG